MTQERPPTGSVFKDIRAEISSDLYEECSMEDYVAKIIEDPRLVRTAHQRLYDTILSHGVDKYRRFKQDMVRYRIFDDPFTDDRSHAIYGRNVDLALMRLVRTLGAAAQGLGQERRILLLHGPIGTAKSTAAELLSVALEEYTKTPNGRLYAPFWVVDKDDEEGMEILGTLGRKFERHRKDCPLNEEPLAVLPPAIRLEVLKHVSGKAGKPVTVHTNACPVCDMVFERFLRRENFDWRAVIEKHLRVKRLVLSKSKRVGIVVARPKSEKDQDVTEFLGEHNFRDLGVYGDTSDPRTFNFAGHYLAGNRGIFYWEEELKFALSFLYDLLGASQEHRVQPRNFREVEIDEVLFGSTNPPEYAKMKENDAMGALRDRTITVNIPYNLEFDNEKKIYQKDFSEPKRGGKHLAPHAIEVAAFWALLTRVEDPKRSELDRRGKVRLYNGQQVPGFNEDSIKELMAEAEKEGMQDAISPRYIQDKVSAALMAADEKPCVNSFLVLQELRAGLKQHPHIKTKEVRTQYEKLLEVATEELTEWLKDDLQKAIVGDDEALKNLFAKYIDQITADLNGDKVKDETTGEDVQPDEDFMRGIEDKIEITEHKGFRQKIVNAMHKRARDRALDKSVEAFGYKTDERLYNALKLALFEQAKERINWEYLISKKALDNEGQEKIETIKTRLVNNLGYCQICAMEVMTHVASIFRRGEKAKKS